MANVNDTYLLAIESAISGGSIAIFNGEGSISGSSCGDSVSRAEDLLPRVIDILADAGISKQQLTRIAISLGPGSYTGLRIGIATVMGLCRGLGIDHVGIPLFDAIKDYYDDGNSVIALPMGRSDICVSETRSGEAWITSLEHLKLEIPQWPALRLLAHSDLVPDLIKIRPDVVDIGTNLARFIATAAVWRSKSSSLDPIYIQNPRFG